MFAPSFCGININGITTQQVREKLSQQRHCSPCGVNFWRRKYNRDLIADKIFLRSFKATKESRLRILQWKILHNIYPTSILLNKMGLKENSNCDACGERDFIEHVFCSCPRITPVWEDIHQKISESLGFEIELNEQQKLFGVSNDDAPQFLVAKINHLILIVKMCISKFIYGDYNNIINLLNYEITLRKAI